MFDYAQAFVRNIGILSPAEQEVLQGATVAIAGMGGVGGDYVITLARCGVGGFHLADFDRFELANFNRQYGATLSAVGQMKVDVMSRLARDINPDLRVRLFSEGVTAATLDAFLEGCQVVIDGIDLFEPDSHKMLIEGAVARGLPVLAAVPLGFGAAMVNFDARGMSFADYFDFRPGMGDDEKTLQLALGFAPAGFHLRYIDPRSVSLKERRGPSSAIGVKLCAGLIAAHTVEAILHPERLRTAPWYAHVDAKLLRLRTGRLWRGNRNPLQRLKRGVALSRLAKGGAVG
jgi:hypothetical protein